MFSTQLVTNISLKKKKRTSKHVSNDHAINNLHIDRNFVMSTRENVDASSGNERPAIPSRIVSSISEDKLHRRDPHAVRQEIQLFDDLAPETALADVQLSEMPGLQNTEQWKRIAARSGQASLPLSRHYYQTVVPMQDAQMPQVPGSFRPSDLNENEQNPASIVPSVKRIRHRRLVFGLSIAVIIIAIIVAIIVAVTLVRKPGQIITDYYSGSILVQTRFDSILSDSSSTLAKNYQREFCSLIGSTLVDTKTKYAIFYSTCTVSKFRNGSIIGDFILGFTRYQNLTRLNAFLNRTLFSNQLFGGAILSITFNFSTNNSLNMTDFDYTENGFMSLITTEQDTISNSFNKQNQNSSNEEQSQIKYTRTDKALSTSQDLTSLSTSTDFVPLATTPFKQIDSTNSLSLGNNSEDKYSTSNIIKRKKRLQDYLLEYNTMPNKRNYYVYRPLYSDNTSISPII